MGTTNKHNVFLYFPSLVSVWTSSSRENCLWFRTKQLVQVLVLGHFSPTTLFVEVISDFQVSLLISANSMVSFLMHIFYIKNDITLNSSYEVLIDQIQDTQKLRLASSFGKMRGVALLVVCSVLFCVCVCVCVCLVFPYQMRAPLVYVWCMCSRDQHSWWVQLTGNRFLIAALQPQSIIMKTTNFVKYNVYVLFGCH